MKISILGGAGLMGSGIVRDLLSDRAIINLTSVRICDTSPERMEALVADLGDSRIELFDLNVTDHAQLAAAICGADLCINCVPTLLGYQMTIFEAALSAKVAYMDLGGLGTYTVKQIGEHAKFKDAGVTAVVGVGADPGTSNVICRAVADEMDEIDRINLYWAAEFEGPENPVLVPPYSISTVLAEYSKPSTQFLGGKHVQCPPLTGTEIIDLPEPWGRCEFMYSPHSEQLTVPLAEGIADKGIKEFTWKLHLPHREHEAWVGLVKAGFGDFDEPVIVNGVSVRPLDVLSKVIARNMEKNAAQIPSQTCHEIHFAIGHGRKGGRPVKVQVQLVGTGDPMYAPYVDACTSMSASIAAQLVLKNPKKPGVYAPEAYFSAAEFFAELEKRMFKVTKTVTYLD